MVGPSWPHIACMCLQDSSRPRKGYAEQHDEGCRWSQYCGAEGEGDEKSEYGEEDDKRATDQARAEKEKQA
eukprot:scaffold5406_cov129-Isochrysis_galbana.AAC.1